MPADQSNLRLFEQWMDRVACPACHGTLRLEDGLVLCASCGRGYPIVDGIPILIAERGALRESK